MIHSPGAVDKRGVIFYKEISDITPRAFASVNGKPLMEIGFHS